jgi:hypothetical protein
MHLSKKLVGVAAVVAFLAFAPAASAGFTPPTDITPYLPANNAVTVTRISSNAAIDVYRPSAGPLLTVRHNTPMATVLKAASANLSWTKFLAATVSPDSQHDASVVQTAQVWFIQNIYNRFYR